ncbi:MAG: transcription-repair coupling factor [Halanaerobiaceae bacterium]
MDFNSLFLRSKKTEEILKTINRGKNISVNGLDEARLAYFIGNIYQKIDNYILLITYDNFHLDMYYENLIRLLDERDIFIYPELEALPHEQIVRDMQETGTRLRILEHLLFRERPVIILVNVNSLMKKMMPARYFKEYTIRLEKEKEIDFKKLTSRLLILGYERVNMVEDQGQFSIRGGIVDIYPLSAGRPCRLELFGDEIDSIRDFDLASQRSRQSLKKLIIPPAREIILFPEKIQNTLPEIEKDFLRTVNKLETIDRREEAGYLKDKMKELLEKLEEINEFPGYEQFLPYFFLNLDSLFNYLPSDTYLFFDQTKRIWRKAQNFELEIAETQATLLEQGSVLPSYINNFQTAEDFRAEVKKFSSIFFSGQINGDNFSSAEKFSFTTRGVEPYHGKIELFSAGIKKLLKSNYRVMITLNSASKARRITEFLEDKDMPAVFDKGSFKKGQIIVKEGSLSEGFIIEDIRLAVYTEKEVFGKPQKKKRHLKELKDGVEISSLKELTVGDYVVHENHGIGKYLGVKTMEIQGKHLDYLVIKYAGEDKLYVPTEQVNQVQKYIGADQHAPKLYKLGSSKWNRVKQRVQNSVKEMAIGLLELYAERETVEGYAFSEDTVWQQEFEEAFPYEETPDQRQAIIDVKADMENSTPMDRLICGDVGYGKTEVAIRAAFKAVMDGKQTAVLVPTTILAQQHYNTFRHRMDNYPVNIEMISRFRTQKEQREVLRKLAAGEVDIIIGTHRLLSRDINFNDLGLLIVDEEQRFGVTHKEKLKDFKRNVDVLTLTATPIPRTLHMALVGVRDMSVIETPPENRYPIRTYIREFNQELIRDAIRKEINREGQVYFVHNRVEDIDQKADRIRELLPDCRVAVAHGQMNENHLERVMFDFYNREYDVLVCTTIIENGLDLPNVNTIIINRAEQMGLAQLYQLRGRVGRSNRIAYAYLLYEKDRLLPEIAEKRLKAIKEFTNLGSGFKIAMRDLEIRGAGNLLGPEQHGHIASVGFSLYCKLLENAVREIKGEKETQKDKKVEIKLNLDAYLSDEYIPDSGQKIEIYKRIMASKEEEYSDVVDELIDRFGEPPVEVMNLIKISRIKDKANMLGINKITQEDNIINNYFVDDRFTGDTVFKLIDKYPGKIKVRSGKTPVIGIKTSKIDLYEKVLDDFISFLNDKNREN